ncbi:2',3'-cyclic-nucleotide 3'-phosphodiesterase [Limtongia smithiae]|uniref:2',3'-cyclic-nucleotide 3'-phosphodiesterase n=1 Tax=Limtongia smithiae TaxID=1125753 RepID=UPI0034CF0083
MVQPRAHLPYREFTTTTIITMPGLSLWLSPPPSSPTCPALTKLIADLASTHFPGPSPAPAPVFTPHITITSNIPEDKVDPLAVVTTVAAVATAPLSTDISATVVDTGPAYFKKIFLRIAPVSGLLEMARIARENFVCSFQPELDEPSVAAEIWLRAEYDPHLSLVYTDEWPLSSEKLDAVSALVFQALAGVVDSSDDDAAIGKLWRGGRVELVKTTGPADTWQVLAHCDIK